VRIALVAPLVSPIGGAQLGGAQSVIADLALGLTQRGHHVDVYAAAGSSVDGVRVVETGVDSATLVAARYRHGRGRAGAPEALRDAFRSVYATVALQEYDVVHNHAFDASAITLAADIPARVVHTLHLPPDVAVAGAIRATRKKPHPPTIGAVSASQAWAWSHLEPVDVILANGVPTSRMPWSHRAGRGVVYAGRLSHEKGAAEAIAIARAAGLDIDVFGEAYDPGYSAQRIEPWRDAPGVALSGPVDRTLLWDRMMTAAVVLCPSLWDEPFGMVAAEAQAVGTPVVAFALGNLPHIVIDGLTGFVTTPGDVGEAAAALRRTPGIRREACRQHAERHLDLEASLDAHERCYRKATSPAGVATGAGN
jgi:glycosyltransferase involved in cell wall biosynthesis